MGYVERAGIREADDASVFARGDGPGGPDGEDSAGGELGTDHGTVHRVATQLGYGVESGRMWVKQADIDDGTVAGVSTTEARGVRELEQEVRELRRANEILKRAASFFRAELDRRHRKWSRSSTRTRTTSSKVARSGSSPSARFCRWRRVRITRRKTVRRRRAQSATRSSLRSWSRSGRPRVALGSTSGGTRRAGSCAQQGSRVRFGRSG